MIGYLIAALVIVAYIAVVAKLVKIAVREIRASRERFRGSVDAIHEQPPILQSSLSDATKRSLQ